MAIITNMCLVMNTQTNEVLVQNRLKNWKGLAFPGGHVEYDESLHDAVVREIYEETGLIIQNPKLCGMKSYTDYQDELQVVVCYKTTDFTGELHSGTSEGEVFWTNLEELTPDNTAMGFLDMLPVFFKDIDECHYAKGATKASLY